MLCDIGYIIQDHVPAMMQLLTNEPALRDYNMMMIKTKCLNTAIVMWYLFLGETDRVEVCNSRTAQARGLQCLRENDYEHNPNNPRNVAERLAKDLLDTQGDPNASTTECITTRTLFYIMMTDCAMPHVSEGTSFLKGGRGRGRGTRGVTPSVMHKSAEHKGGNDAVEPPKQKFFPGHVYVIEKVHCPELDEPPRYNMYQSYIDHYTLQGHIQMNKSLAMSFQKARDVVEGIRHLYTNPRWDEVDTRFWKRLTHVDCSDLEGYKFSDTSFLCYVKANTTNCITNLRKYLTSKMQELDAARQRTLKGDSTTKAFQNDTYGNPTRTITCYEFDNTVYGDPSRYSAEEVKVQRAMTNGEIYESIRDLRNKLG
jgi:hypothetical protein